MHKEIGKSKVQMENKFITKENINFLESQTEISNSKHDQNE